MNLPVKFYAVMNSKGEFLTVKGSWSVFIVEAYRVKYRHSVPNVLLAFGIRDRVALVAVCDNMNILK